MDTCLILSITIILATRREGENMTRKIIADDGSSNNKKGEKMDEMREKVK